MDIDIKNFITKKNIGFYCNDILLANGKFATILLILTYAKVLLQSNDKIIRLSILLLGILGGCNEKS